MAILNTIVEDECRHSLRFRGGGGGSLHPRAREVCLPVMKPYGP